MNHKIKHPSYYNQGTLEVKDAILGVLGKEKYKGFCQGNVIKYVTRYEQKGGIEDLKKAHFYLDELIQTEEN